MHLPKSFEEKMSAFLGEDYSAYLQTLEEPFHYGLRINIGKISVVDFLKIAPWPLKPIPWIENGFYYDGNTYQPAKHPYYFAGLYYLQEPSAMTPANRLLIEAGDKVLDLCAAPGGKATELGAKLKEDGLLVVNDISNSRAKGLLKNIELAGIGNVLVVNEDSNKLKKHFYGFFDKILIDAPCSGEGMFRKDVKMIKAWEAQGPEYFSQIQKNVILDGAQMLKADGLLLYSTCTFDRRENEEVITYLLKQCPEFELLEIKGHEGFLDGIATEHNPALSKTKRLYPHRIKGEGHFLALLKKGSTQSKECPQKPKQTKEASKSEHSVVLNDFLKNIHRTFDFNRLMIQNERVYFLPENLPNLKGLRFLRTGLLLGELKKKRFEPSQALAMHLKKEAYQHVIDLKCSDVRVTKYLKGETINLEDVTNSKEKGWYLFCVDGFPLGFGKLANQTLKNKYQTGWRLQ
ncbi:MAG: RsmB/NOP family class I SAM-dependent RNA methyltransferase [Lachnospiraceae bacterium]|nr:RsmB/NOP family class I SAM-dependent RNA methyltransferase [Lachnospiraceae bacterium]